MNNTGASGAIPRSDMRRMDNHAVLYYEEIRKRNSDIKLYNYTKYVKDLDLKEGIK